jgi:N-acetylglucosaminyl-diphospho-decaprenol L-rhamnosyltransferase
VTLPLLSVITVNFNSSDLLERCLRALQETARSPHEVIVIDNASEPHDRASAGRVAAGFGAQFLQNDRNVGFAAAANHAASLARAPYLFFLNPDVVLHAECADRLAGLLDHLPTAGAIGPALLTPGARYVPPGGPEPAFWSLLRYKTRLSLRSLWSRVVSTPTEQQPPSEPRQVEWISGAVMCCRAAAWQQVGGMDPHFFLYFEDVDLCRRLRAAGWQIWFDSRAKATHAAGGSQRQAGGAVSPHYYQGLLYYVRKHHGRLNHLVIKALLTPYRALGMRRFLQGRAL